MKRPIHQPAISNDDIIRQQTVEAFQKGLRRKIRLAKKIGHLAEGMHLGDSATQLNLRKEKAPKSDQPGNSSGKDKAKGKDKDKDKEEDEEDEDEDDD